MKQILTVKGIKYDTRTGRRYLDISSDAADELGATVLIPLIVLNGEPNNATSNVASAINAATIPTTKDMRDLLSEADAILADSSDNSTERSNSETNSTNSESSLSVAGDKSFSLVTASIAACAMVVSFVVGLLIGKF